MSLLKGFELESAVGFDQLPAAEPVLPVPGLLDTTAAVFRRNRAGVDWGWNQSRYEFDAQGEIMGELRKRGYDLPNYSITAARLNRQRIARGDQPNFLAMQSVEADDALWKALAAERRRDPKFLSDYGEVRDLSSLTASMEQRRKRAAAAEEPLISRAGTGTRIAAELGGGIGAGLLDPTSFIPVGGGVTQGVSAGRQILNVGLREAVANVAVTGALEYSTRQDAERLGIDRDWVDTAIDLGVAGGTGFTIGGGAKAIELGAPKVGDAAATVREGLIGRYFDKLPTALQERMINASTIDDRLTAAAASELIGPERMTPDERAAIATLEADADVRESNPFKPGLGGDLEHGRRLSASVEALLSGEPVPAFVPPKRPPLRSSTVLSSTDRDIAGRIIMSESGGDPNARNPGKGQTASGLGQFIDETWLNGIKRWFPSQARGRTDEQLIALKSDPVLGRQMTERAVQEYRGVLEKAGHQVTAANAYLIHFLGPKRAITLLRAPANMEIRRFLPEGVIAANERVLRGKTVGDVRAWAARSMGDDAAAPTIREADPLDDAVALRPEQFDSAVDRRAAETALYGDSRVGEPTIEDLAESEASPAARIRELGDRMRRPVDQGPVDLLTSIARWGGLRDDEGNDFAGGSGLGRKMTRGGPVLRKGGMGVDELGERLWGEGWFGPPSQVDRPTLDEVVDLVEEAARGKVYHPEERELVAERLRTMDDGSDEIGQMIDRSADEMGIEVDAPMRAELEAKIRRGEDPDEALIGSVNDRLFDEMATDARAAGAEPAEPTEALSDADWAELDEMRNALDAFDDPEGQAMVDQAMSIEHDLRMAIEADGADPVDGQRFAIDDSGDLHSAADILAEADRDAAAVATMRSCMIPVKGASE